MEGTCDPQREHGQSENSKHRTEKGKREAERDREHLQRRHVIEGMVQLLANGFVLQLLSIQFIWRPEVNRKCRQVPRTAATQTSQKQDDNERQMEAKSRGRKEKTKNRSGFLKMQKCSEERMMDANLSMLATLRRGEL